jgi:hypothetical protein
MSSSFSRLALSSILCLLAVQAYAETATPRFLGETTQVTDTGYYTLRWSNPKQQPVTIDRATSIDFHDSQPVFQGTETSTFVTGLGDGTYYFRLQSETVQPDILRLTVAHRSLTESLALFCVGAIVFLASALVILRGVR